MITLNKHNAPPLRWATTGATGRGNRGNGLIMPMRPLTLGGHSRKESSQQDRLAHQRQQLLRGVQISGDTATTAAMEAIVDAILDFWQESTKALVL